MRRAALAASLLGLAGCFAPPSAAQRLSDAAVEMNTATRFGRMDIALERVAQASRAEFARRHAPWGRGIRVVDLELGGFDLLKRDEAEVLVNVAWQRPDEATIRTTQLAQRWRDERGSWLLIGEKRRDGDPGLLGESAPARPEPTQAGNASAATDPGGGAAQSSPAPQRLGFQRRVIREE
jgi:hypothetical protein